MVLSPPPKKPEELGFYMPNSPFAKIAEEDGLDFNADKVFKKAELSAAQKENDVFDEHHVGRRWAEKLALMTRKTGAFHELQGVRTPYGGIDEDGVDPWIPESQIQAAKEDAKKKLRVASRKYQGERLAEEHKKINEELLAKIGRPKVPRNREKGSPSSVMDAQLVDGGAELQGAAYVQEAVKWDSDSDPDESSEDKHLQP